MQLTLVRSRTAVNQIFISFLSSRQSATTAMTHLHTAALKSEKCHHQNEFNGEKEEQMKENCQIPRNCYNNVTYVGREWHILEH